MRPHLTEGQITSQDQEAGICKLIRQGGEQRRLAVCPRTVSKHKRIARRHRWCVQETSNSRLNGAVGEWRGSA